MELEVLPPSVDFLYFVQHFLYENRPCLLANEFVDTWKARMFWQKDGIPNIEYLRYEFGDADVPVADCNDIHFSSHPKTTWKLKDYLSYWKQLQTSCKKTTDEDFDTEKRLLYLKDWHFTKDYPLYGAYRTPDVFCSDWLNEFWDQRTDTEDDYRFVYMGPKGTWTPFHADVFRSYSWSFNVCGKKEWLLFPPGEEEHLHDKLGNLPFDVTSPELQDSSLYPNAHKARPPICVIQESGYTIFVPSGWYHQVRNLEDTISINHNWTNAFGIHYLQNYLKKELTLVEEVIDDCRDMVGYEDQCQLILKSSAGMDFNDFCQFLDAIAQPRLKQLRELRETPCVSDITDGLQSILHRCTNFQIDLYTRVAFLINSLPEDLKSAVISCWDRMESDIQKFLLLFRVFELHSINEILKDLKINCSLMTSWNYIDLKSEIV